MGTFYADLAIWPNCSALLGELPSQFDFERPPGCSRAARAVSLFYVESVDDGAMLGKWTQETATQPPEPPELIDRGASAPNPEIGTSETAPPPATATSGTAKQFLYLVQSDVCIDLSHLKSGRSEALLLVWKAPPGPACPGAIFYPNSTLVQGRNRLWAAARAAFPGAGFAYYVMMDGDVSLEEVRDFGFNTGDAWATLEGYLLEWGPAVGFPHFGAADYDAAREAQPVFNFDQIVVAYHAEAAPLLLPYTEAFDGVSWWYCGSVQNALAAAVYGGHRLQFNALRALSWVSNPSPSYLRASNFLYPLAWIAPAITSLDGLMAIPWYAPFHSAQPNEWDSRSRAWRPSGAPRKKGARSYRVGQKDGRLDYCHEYFRGREMEAWCTQATDGRSDRAGPGAVERVVLARLEELWAAAVASAVQLGREGREGLAVRAGGVAERAAALAGAVSALGQGEGGEGAEACVPDGGQCSSANRSAWIPQMQVGGKLKS